MGAHDRLEARYSEMVFECSRAIVTGVAVAVGAADRTSITLTHF